MLAPEFQATQPQWGNNSQMVSFLRNFLDVNSKPDLLSASPPQAYQVDAYDGISQASLQNRLFDGSLPKNKPAIMPLANMYKKELDAVLEREAIHNSSQSKNSFVKGDTLSELYPCKNLVKDPPAVSQDMFRHDMFDPFAFGEPVEDSLSNPKSNKLRPSISPNELDTFSPLVGFEDDFMVHPVLFGQLDTIGFAPLKAMKEECVVKKKVLCRKRDTAEPLRPQKKIRTTFAVTEAAVAKIEPTVAAKEPVKVARSRKNNRERQRRQGLNQKFQELIEVLSLQDCRNAMRVGAGSKGPKWNKNDILSEAIHAITNLRTRLTSTEARLHVLGSR